MIIGVHDALGLVDMHVEAVYVGHRFDRKISPAKLLGEIERRASVKAGKVIRLDILIAVNKFKQSVGGVGIPGVGFSRIRVARLHAYRKHGIAERIFRRILRDGIVGGNFVRGDGEHDPARSVHNARAPFAEQLQLYVLARIIGLLEFGLIRSAHEKPTALYVVGGRKAVRSVLDFAVFIKFVERIPQRRAVRYDLVSPFLLPVSVGRAACETA